MSGVTACFSLPSQTHLVGATALEIRTIANLLWCSHLVHRPCGMCYSGDRCGCLVVLPIKWLKTGIMTKNQIEEKSRTNQRVIESGTNLIFLLRSVDGREATGAADV